jgi:uncharacterized delta-60 repeat protein
MKGVRIFWVLAVACSDSSPVSVVADLPADQNAILVIADEGGAPVSEPMLFESDQPAFRLTADAKSPVRLFAVTFATPENGGPDLANCEVSLDSDDPLLPEPLGVWSTELVKLADVDALELSPHTGGAPFMLRSTCDPCGTRPHLDESFGDRGTAIIAIQGEPDGSSSDLDRDRGQVMTVDAEGRILFGGETWNEAIPGFDFALVRLLSDGTLDPSFGVGGKLSTPLATRARVRGIRVDRAGRIVVAAFDGDDRFSLFRFTESGELDPSFGQNGSVLTDIFAASGHNVQALDLQSDGKIILGGTDMPGFTNALAVARYDETGVLDPSFGVGGHAVIDTTERRDFVNSLRVQGDDRIVAAGISDSMPASGNFVLVRLEADGAMDRTFNGTGVVVLQAGVSGALGVAVLPDGKIVAVGSTRSGALDANQVPQDSVLVRVDPAGRLDPTFGDNGIVQVGLDGLGYDATYEIEPAPDGTVYVSGSWQDINAGAMFVAHFLEDASLDNCFGDKGVFSDYASRFDDRATTLVRLDDGSLLVGGCAECTICADCSEYGDFLVFKVAP